MHFFIIIANKKFNKSIIFLSSFCAPFLGVLIPCKICTLVLMIDIKFKTNFIDDYTITTTLLA